MPTAESIAYVPPRITGDSVDTPSPFVPIVMLPVVMCSIASALLSIVPPVIVISDEEFIPAEIAVLSQSISPPVMLI